MHSDSVRLAKNVSRKILPKGGGPFLAMGSNPRGGGHMGRRSLPLVNPLLGQNAIDHIYVIRHLDQVNIL